MSSPRPPTTMENRPGEVLSEICVRLLAKQIGQMRCISKSWNALLSESSFLKFHLHHSINKKDEILLFFRRSFSFELHPKPFRAYPSTSPDLELPSSIKPPALPECKYGFGLLIGSVNGLICFAYRSERPSAFSLHIWNPSLSSILSLPPFRFGLHRLHFGFGFDPKSDDYKVLQLTSFSRASNKVDRAEVYSMRKGSWNLIPPQTFPSHITIPKGHDNQICVEDHLHWLSDTDLELKPQTILGFDLGEEAFVEIPLPETILDFNVYKPFTVLGALGGKLCVMSRVVRDGGKWEVWVMDEYGAAKSWVKHHVFSQFSAYIMPYGFTSKGEFLFQVGINDDGFGLYDPVAANTNIFHIMFTHSSSVVEYVDSLVWVPAPKHEIKVKRKGRKRKQDIGAMMKWTK